MACDKFVAFAGFGGWGWRTHANKSERIRRPTNKSCRLWAFLPCRACRSRHGPPEDDFASRRDERWLFGAF